MPGIIVTSAARHVADADGQHHDRERGLAEDRADHDALGHAGRTRAIAATAPITASQNGKPSMVMQRQAEERAQHHQVALGEVDGLGGLVDQHEAQRDQAVDAALRDAADDDLENCKLLPLG